MNGSISPALYQPSEVLANEVCHTAPAEGDVKKTAEKPTSYIHKYSYHHIQLCQCGNVAHLIFIKLYCWSFVYIRKTYVDQSPKPQNVQILKMCAFSPNLHKMHIFS